MGCVIVNVIKRSYTKILCSKCCLRVKVNEHENSKIFQPSTNEMSYQYLAIVCTDRRYRTLSITTTISNTFGTGLVSGGEYFTRLANLLHITKLLTQDSRLLDWGCGSPRHSFSWTGQLAHESRPRDACGPDLFSGCRTLYKLRYPQWEGKLTPKSTASPSLVILHPYASMFSPLTRCQRKRPIASRLHYLYIRFGR